MQKLPMLMLPKQPPVVVEKEEENGDGETSPILYEVPDPLMVHIVNAKEKYTNE